MKQRTSVRFPSGPTRHPRRWEMISPCSASTTMTARAAWETCTGSLPCCGRLPRYCAELMRQASVLAFAAFVSLSGTVQAADRIAVTLHNESRIARANETIVIPFTQVQRLLPNLAFDQIIVRDAKGSPVPSQVTALRHIHRGPPQYDDLIFQHSFAAGEQRAVVTLEPSATPQPPFDSRVWAGHVPERYDDFAWENDLSAHRAYGPGLELQSAGPDQMTSSGLDLWTKKVPYRVTDRWYRKGHDGLHSDTGEGLDFYEVGTNRGVGGT